MSTRHKPVVDEPAAEPASAETPETGEQETSGKTVIRVRRGALRRFDHLKQKSANLPVDIKWDRRTGDRRGATAEPGAEPPKTERRQKPPFTWDVADFVVVGDTSSRADEPAEHPEPRRKTKP